MRKIGYLILLSTLIFLANCSTSDNYLRLNFSDNPKKIKKVFKPILDRENTQHTLFKEYYNDEESRILNERRKDIIKIQAYIFPYIVNEKANDGLYYYVFHIKSRKMFYPVIKWQHITRVVYFLKFGEKLIFSSPNEQKDEMVLKKYESLLKRKFNPEEIDKIKKYFKQGFGRVKQR